MFKRNVIRSLKIFALATITCGIVYPLTMTAIGQVAFNKEVNGNIIEVDGKMYGSELLGQNFVEDKHLWGRPVAMEKIDTSSFVDGDKRYYFAYPSNISPESQAFKEWTEDRLNYILDHNKEMAGVPVPEELIYQSGSGLDPHISYDTALYQVKRLTSCYVDIYTEQQIISIIDNCTTKSWFNLFGNKLTNVLMVNLYLEGIL